MVASIVQLGPSSGIAGFLPIMIVLWLIAMINPLSTGDSVVKFAAVVAIAIGLVVAKYQYFDIESTDCKSPKVCLQFQFSCLTF